MAVPTNTSVHTAEEKTNSERANQDKADQPSEEFAPGPRSKRRLLPQCNEWQEDSPSGA
jgi:hypothetical protein